MFDLEDNPESRTVEYPITSVDPDRATEVAPGSKLSHEPTEVSRKRRDMSSEGAAALRSVPLDPPELAGSIGRLAHYEILGFEGRGAMGVVVRSLDTQLNRIVAIKLISPPLMSNEQAVSRFLREARAAAVINHPNVVTIHAVSEHNGIPFLVMEYVDGRSLMDRIRSDSPMGVIDVLRISLQLASGLAAAHRQGVIHRDIKPANIMLEDGLERVKITDFGLARVFQDQSELTSQGDVVGTPAYMSPEQVNGLPLDQRSDLFSLGCVIYAMIAGHSPFRGENVFGTARRIATQDHVPLGELAQDIPGSFVRVVDRLLEKRPEDRYQSADEIVEDLRVLLLKADRGEVEVNPETHRLAPRKHLNGALLFVLSVVLAVAALALVSRSGDRPWINGSLLGRQTSTSDQVLTVSKRPGALYSSIAEALLRARNGQIIRVLDSEVYDEPLETIGAGRLDGLRLEATSGAILRNGRGRSILMIEGTSGVEVSGFRLEAIREQHAIELRGPCAGVTIRDCEIFCPTDSTRAALFLHKGARGRPDAPILLKNLQIHCGGVGVVVGEDGELDPVADVELTQSRIQATGRDFGTPVVLQNKAHHIKIHRNLISSGVAGVSLMFRDPDRASDVVVSENSLGDLQFAFALNTSSHSQNITIARNLVADACFVCPVEGGVGVFEGWFRGNWAERGQSCDEATASRLTEYKETLVFTSRDPSSADYLELAGPSTPARPGRHAAPD